MEFQPTRPLRGATASLELLAQSTRISTHAPLAGRDQYAVFTFLCDEISTHAPLAGRDTTATSITTAARNFNPRAPCGARPWQTWLSPSLPNFNPRAPCGARRYFGFIINLQFRFQPTRPLRGATVHRVVVLAVRLISTHEPLAGRDGSPRRRLPRRPVHFNPRAPCGARPSSFGSRITSPEFQPTRPLRGATQLLPNLPGRAGISTHAPLAGRDFVSVQMWYPLKEFQPTRPLRGATCKTVQRLLNWTQNFNPRAPCGARLAALTSVLMWLYFNPRAPCGARQQKCTNHYAHFCDNRQISDAFAQNAACQGILLLFDAGKPCGFWVRTAQVISAHLCFAL